MRVHYVEDNDTDAELYSRMIRGEGGMEIFVSPRLEDFEKSGNREQTDFIMLDVRRPDAVSVEDDIRRIRAFTDAPIVLVTSDGSDSIRTEGFQGGVDAILDKGDLSPQLLRQIAKNSTIRHRIKRTHAFQALEEESRLPSEAMKVSLNSLSSTFGYIETSLHTLFETLEDTGRQKSAEYVSHLVETVQAIRAYSQDDLSKATRTPVHELMIETARRVSKEARSRGVDLVLETENSWFTQMGSQPLAALGMNHLIGGLLRACDRGDRIAVRTERDENGTALNLFLSRVVLDSVDALYDLERANPAMGFDARASVQLGLTLLSVSRHQVDVHIHRKNLFIKILI